MSFCSLGHAFLAHFFISFLTPLSCLSTSHHGGKMEGGDMRSFSISSFSVCLQCQLGLGGALREPPPPRGPSKDFHLLLSLVLLRLSYRPGLMWSSQLGTQPTFAPEVCRFLGEWGFKKQEGVGRAGTLLSHHGSSFVYQNWPRQPRASLPFLQSPSGGMLFPNTLLSGRPRKNPPFLLFAFLCVP